jgi:hypothetical protein
MAKPNKRIAAEVRDQERHRRRAHYLREHLSHNISSRNRRRVLNRGEQIIHIQPRSPTRTHHPIVGTQKRHDLSTDAQPLQHARQGSRLSPRLTSSSGSVRPTV